MIYKINSYYLSNRSKLLVIPTVVVVCLVGVFFLNVGFKFSFFAEALGSNGPNKSLPDSYFLHKKPLGLLDSSAPDLPKADFSTSSIKIDSENCTLTEAIAPQNYSEVGENVVYWSSDNCEGLTGIGVVFKPDKARLTGFSTQVLKKDILLMQSSADNLWLDKVLQYSNTLTAPLSAQVKSFTVSAKDTYTFEDFTYYLDGECSLKNLLNCKFWRVNNKTGDFELVVDSFQNIAEALNKTVQDPNYSLRISSFVISDSGKFNILLTKGNSSKTWLITIDSNASNILDFKNLLKEDKVFVNKYFR